jgi:hypothetical protein
MMYAREVPGGLVGLRTPARRLTAGNLDETAFRFGAPDTGLERRKRSRMRQERARNARDWSFQEFSSVFERCAEIRHNLQLRKHI